MLDQKERRLFSLARVEDTSACRVVWPIRVGTGLSHRDNLIEVKKQLLVLEARLFQVWLYTARTEVEVIIHNAL